MRLHPSILALTLVVLALPIRAANPAISVESGTISLSGGGLINIGFVAADQAISSLQFDLRYPPQAFALTASAGSAAGNTGKTVYTSNPQPDVLRVLIAGMNQTPISTGVIATLSVQLNAGTAVGAYPLSIENTAASTPDAGPVALTSFNGSVTVSTAILGPAIAAVVNAASYAAGAVAPGEMVVIFGSSLGSSTLAGLQLTPVGTVATSLAESRVLFDGTPAPLLYTSAAQISAIVPYGLDGHSQTSVQVEYQGVRSASVLLPVAKAIPGIFTADSSGRGRGAIVNQDGSINTSDNPAPAGSVVSIYGTGDGQTLPGGIDGIIIRGPADLRYTLLPVTASIGGQSAEVIYTGSVGGEVAGIFQANVRVPKGLPSGSTLPVTLTVGDSVSQPGVTIAVL